MERGHRCPHFRMPSDLEQPLWSVLSDRGCEQNGLTHEDARRLVHRLGGESRHGLVIITDEAAGRMNPLPGNERESRISNPA